MRNGNIALLNNINLDFLGIKLRSLIRTPILWLAFLQIEFICSEKFSLESNTSPRSIEKAFDSVHRDSLWLIMQSYGIPSKIISIVKAFYDLFACALVDGQSTERSGLRSKLE